MTIKLAIEIRTNEAAISLTSWVFDVYIGMIRFGVDRWFPLPPIQTIKTTYGDSKKSTLTSADSVFILLVILLSTLWCLLTKVLKSVLTIHAKIYYSKSVRKKIVMGDFVGLILNRREEYIRNRLIDYHILYSPLQI